MQSPARGAGGLSHEGKVPCASFLHTRRVTLRWSAVAPEDAGVKRESGVHTTAGAGAVQGTCRGRATSAGCARASSQGTFPGVAATIGTTLRVVEPPLYAWVPGRL